LQIRIHYEILKMKKQDPLFILCLLCSLNSLGQTTPNGPIISFDQTKIVDTIFCDTLITGNLKIPAKSYYFHFTNIGDTPLVVELALGNGLAFNCQYPKEPIAPGGKGCFTICFPEMYSISEATRAFDVHVSDTIVRLIVERDFVIFRSDTSFNETISTFHQKICDCSVVINSGLNLIEFKEPDSVATLPETNDTIIYETKNYPDSTKTFVTQNGYFIEESTLYHIKGKNGKNPKYSKAKYVEFKNGIIIKITIITTRFRYGSPGSYWGQPIKKKQKTEVYENGKWTILRGKWYRCAVPVMG